jgi:hypothetical protein
MVVSRTFTAHGLIVGHNDQLQAVGNTMKKLLSILLAAAALIGSGTQASALTDWRLLAYTRDTDSYGPYISLTAGIVNPEWVKVVLTDGTYAGTTNVSVSLSCRDNSFNSFDRSFSQSFYLPRHFYWDIPTSMTYCRVSVSAYHFNSGGLATGVYARY